MASRKKHTLSHLTASGEISMVDVGSKEVTHREAIASAVVRMKPGTLALVLRNELPKGEVLNTARVAGILAAKLTPSIIPLTHPLALSHIEISFGTSQKEGTIEIRASVRCEGRTGVEIEAMTACAVAALTIYDMCKSAEHGITIERIALEHKSGGKSGTYRAGRRK